MNQREKREREKKWEKRGEEEYITEKEREKKRDEFFSEREREKRMKIMNRISKINWR